MTLKTASCGLIKMLFISNLAGEQSRGAGNSGRDCGPTLVPAPEAPPEGGCCVPVRVCHGAEECQRKWGHSRVSSQ